MLKILYNNNLELGLIFSYATGKTLDRYANVMCEGLKRKRLLFIKEPDIIFKARILENDMIKKGLISNCPEKKIFNTVKSVWKF